MKVKVIKTRNADYQSDLIIKIDDKRVFSVGDGEPEDNSLNRNFSNCYRIPHLLKQAYEAGKAGETFEIVEHNKRDEEDE